ncbi:NotI family restriction endonuclease [Microvirga ossetica]|uniref:NotI family restriction endonuclease n=1 Tax=Microvirga ossetica TaxID=1882682 RepID=UPI003AAEA871
MNSRHGRQESPSSAKSDLLAILQDDGHRQAGRLGYIAVKLGAVEGKPIHVSAIEGQTVYIATVHVTAVERQAVVQRQGVGCRGHGESKRKRHG